MTERRRIAALLAVGVLAACSSSAARTAVPSTTSVASSTVESTAASSTVLTTTTSTTAAPTSTTDPRAANFLGEEVLGTSVEGRPITAIHRGTAGGMVVLLVGVIHGDEDDGLAILDLLRFADLPPSIDLWVLDAMNPDGLAQQVRGNARGVDLNRNFPHDWTAIEFPGHWQYSGTGPASEPETQAFMQFAQRIQPRLTIWYHQDAASVAPSSNADGPLRERYAALTGLELASVTGGTFTGVAATWVRRSVSNAMSFIVELPGSVSAADASMHAAAVVEVISLATTIVGT